MATIEVIVSLFTTSIHIYVLAWLPFFSQLTCPITGQPNVYFIKGRWLFTMNSTDILSGYCVWYPNISCHTDMVNDIFVANTAQSHNNTSIFFFILYMTVFPFNRCTSTVRIDGYFFSPLLKRIRCWNLNFNISLSKFIGDSYSGILMSLDHFETEKNVSINKNIPHEMILSSELWWKDHIDNFKTFRCTQWLKFRNGEITSYFVDMRSTKYIYRITWKTVINFERSYAIMHALGK